MSGKRRMVYSTIRSAERTPLRTVLSRRVLVTLESATEVGLRRRAPTQRGRVSCAMLARAAALEQVYWVRACDGRRSHIANLRVKPRDWSLEVALNNSRRNITFNRLFFFWHLSLPYTNPRVLAIVIPDSSVECLDTYIVELGDSSTSAHHRDDDNEAVKVLRPSSTSSTSQGLGSQ